VGLDEGLKLIVKKADINPELKSHDLTLNKLTLNKRVQGS
jgi:hypothetical protein